MYKLEGNVSPDVMQDIDKLIDAAEKAEAKLDMSAKHATGQNQEQPHNERSSGQGRGQTNCVNRNAGRNGNRHRSAPYPTGGGRSRGAALNATHALPPQEVQFNAAQGFDREHPANSWAPHGVCNQCHREGHSWRDCPDLPARYGPQPARVISWGDPNRGPGRGRGMAGVSIYSSVFDALTSHMIERRAQSLTT